MLHRWRLGFVTLFLLVVTLTGCAISDPRNAARHPEIKQEFTDSSASFEAAIETMEQLRNDYPKADLIKWRREEACIFFLPTGEEECSEVASEAETTFLEIRNLSHIRFQAKDEDRIFFVIDAADPPESYIMFSSSDADSEEYAEERGFSSYEDLGGGWNLLGAIQSLEAHESQWISTLASDS